MGITGGGILSGMASTPGTLDTQNNQPSKNSGDVNTENFNQESLSIIGLYGAWANSLNENKLPSLSFRRTEFQNLESWKKTARQRTIERLGIPDIGGIPKLTVNKVHSYEGLHIEEVSWQLPYGRKTEAILLKPLNAKGKLPAILAFHDHGGNKYFGCTKIARTSDDQHPMMKEHREEYYSNFAWANEIAKRGYVVLVPDAFTFGSRRVMFQDIPPELRRDQNDENSDTPEKIKNYNDWAGNHEHVIAKSLFCAGTTWPAVFF